MWALSRIPSLILGSLLVALAFAALATALVALARSAREAIQARRVHRALLPDDWWTQFEREYRAYAARRTTRDARHRE